jgi:hypothetical protein
VKPSILRFLAVCRYVLPAVHLSACAVISITRIESGWEQMIKIDFPFSLLLGALTYIKDYPLLWFGVLGTLWWFFLPWFFWYVLTHYPFRESQSGG